MHEYTTAQLVTLLLAVAGVCVTGVATYYERQLKKGDAVLDKTREEYQLLIHWISRFPTRIRSFNEAERVDLQALVLLCRRYEETGFLADEVCSELSSTKTRRGFDSLKLDQI